jgi:hypothetical protein
MGYGRTSTVGCRRIPDNSSPKVARNDMREPLLTDYERERLENIERNKIKLRELGLDLSPIKKEQPPVKPKLKKPPKKTSAEPARTSLRVRGKEPVGSVVTESIKAKPEFIPDAGRYRTQTMDHVPTGKEVYLQCTLELGKKRVRVLSDNYIKDANCVFPRAIRQVGRYFSVPDDQISLQKTANGTFFYHVGNGADICILKDTPTAEQLQ